MSRRRGLFFGLLEVLTKQGQDGELANVTHLARGASALAAKARVITSLDFFAVVDPGFRGRNLMDGDVGTGVMTGRTQIRQNSRLLEASVSDTRLKRRP